MLEESHFSLIIRLAVSRLQALGIQSSLAIVRQMMHAWQAPMRVSKLSLTSLL
jgi:hypothetical protein